MGLLETSTAYQAGQVTGYLIFWGTVLVLTSFPLYRVAGRTRDHSAAAWMAWVPIANVILMCRIARVTAWTALVLLAALLPFGPLIAFAYIVVLWVKIGQRFGRTGLGVLAGMLPIVGAWIFAFLIGNEQPAG